MIQVTLKNAVLFCIGFTARNSSPNTLFKYGELAAVKALKSGTVSQGDVDRAKAYALRTWLLETFRSNYGAKKRNA